MKVDFGKIIGELKLYGAMVLEVIVEDIDEEAAR